MCCFDDLVYDVLEKRGALHWAKSWRTLLQMNGHDGTTLLFGGDIASYYISLDDTLNVCEGMHMYSGSRLGLQSVQNAKI